MQRRFLPGVDSPRLPVGATQPGVRLSHASNAERRRDLVQANAYFGSRFIVASLLSAWVAVAFHVWRGLSPEAYLKVSVVLVVAPVAIAGLLTGRFIRMIGAGGQSSNSDR